MGRQDSARDPSGKLPPLIDREHFFEDPEITSACLSPDGRFIAFLRPLDGVRNIWVKGIDEPFASARPLTDDSRRPISIFLWSRDSRHVLFMQDLDGNENFNIFAVDPDAPPAPDRKSPAARNLTRTVNATAEIYWRPKSDPDVMYVGINERDRAWFDVFRIRISSGEKTLLRENRDEVAHWFFDHNGNLRLADRILENGDAEILRIDGDELTRARVCSALETCTVLRFHPDNRRVYLLTNIGEEQDLTRVTLYDPATGQEEPLEQDPLNRVDLGNLVFSAKTGLAVGAVYHDDRPRIHWLDSDFAADCRAIEERLPDRWIQIDSMSADDRLWMIIAAGDTEPGQCLLFDRATGELTLQYLDYEKIPRDYLAPMTVVRYPSSDGLEIQAYLTLPKNLPARSLPLVVSPHGGPWWQTTWGFHPVAQLLANRGYAVLEPNFRGSTGFGKAFLNAGNEEWGEKMQDDITWGVRYLTAEGIADPARVAIRGGSYGGYATLAGVAFTPDVYAAAASVVGPSNLITLLENIPPYWQAVRRIFYVRMGDPNTPEGRARLERQSPLNSADKIRTPLLIVQGANDPRVNKIESEQIVKALRSRGFPVDYLLVPNEGHAFSHPVNVLAWVTATERFLARHIGGRCQPTASPNVARRLAEITVDVNTLT